MEISIEYRDSLSDQNQDKDKYSLVLANPPFKGSLDAESGIFWQKLPLKKDMFTIACI